MYLCDRTYTKLVLNGTESLGYTDCWPTERYLAERDDDCHPQSATKAKQRTPALQCSVPPLPTCGVQRRSQHARIQQKLFEGLRNCKCQLWQRLSGGRPQSPPVT